jgi:predicted NBD/HSP70 family sugar kinase
VDRVASILGYATSHLVAVFSPELIIFGGYVVPAEDVFLPRIRQEMEKHVRPWMGDFELAVSSLGTDIGLKGAASRAFYGILEDSELLKKLARLDPARSPRRASSRSRAVRVPV